MTLAELIVRTLELASDRCLREGGAPMTTAEMIERLERFESAVWDRYYGRGLSVTYARSASADIKAVIAALKEIDNRAKSAAGGGK